MSTFKDILDTISNLEGELTDVIISGKQHKSLSKSAMESILNFPCIVDNSLSIEDATLVNKSLERQFATFVLTVVTMNPYLYTHGEPNAGKYIHKLHQNLDTRVDSTDIHNTMANLLNEAANKLGVDYESLEGLEEHMLYHIYEGVNHSGMNAMNMKFNYTIEDVTESKTLNSLANATPIFERFNPNSYGGMKREQTNNYRGDHIINNNISGDYDGRTDLNIDARNVDMGAMGRELGRAIRNGGGNGGVNRSMTRDVKFLMDNDVKKANELVPTLLHIRIFPVDKSDNDEPLPPIDLVIGIKATIHPVSTDEMITNIARGIKNENKFFNFIRWTTGEISFFKDFVLSMNELKIDAINTGSKSSRWWTMLKRRKALAKIKNRIFPDRLLPNSTIVITQETADTLRNQYGYDLSDSRLAYKLMENYFLIAFVIVDPALQRVKFLFDGKNEFEVQTYATLSREATTNDKQFKEMLNMLGRRL